MTIATSLNTGSTSAAAAGLTGGSSSTSEATAAQDRFLKLLVAQLNNQDPMNPMDNAQMTSQMAQINTVTGINKLNETMANMASQFLATQILQGASMVGHDVLMPSNTLNIHNGQAKGAVNLSGSAETVTVEIRSAGGQLLDTINLGAKPAGHQTFEWDASNYQGQSVRFAVRASNGNQNVTASPMARNTIESISNENGQMQLNLRGGTRVSYSDIAAIY